MDTVAVYPCASFSDARPARPVHLFIPLWWYPVKPSSTATLTNDGTIKPLTALVFHKSCLTNRSFLSLMVMSDILYKRVEPCEQKKKINETFPGSMMS